jgi:hypothetical protein
MSGLGQMRKPQYEEMFSAFQPTTDIRQLRSKRSFHCKFSLAKRSTLRLSRIEERELIFGRRGNAAPTGGREPEL